MSETGIYDYNNFISHMLHDDLRFFFINLLTVCVNN